MLLVGSPGCGKSHYARRLAEFAGVPLRRIDVGSGSSGFRVGGVERGWGSATPSVPVETLLATRVANPLMLVDEIDKSGVVYSDRGMSTSIATSLLEVLDPGTAAHYECPVHRVRIDVSNISWILTANDLRGVPAPLQDRCRVIHVPEPGLPDLLRLYDRMTADIDDVDRPSHILAASAGLRGQARRSPGPSNAQWRMLPCRSGRGPAFQRRPKPGTSAACAT